MAKVRPDSIRLDFDPKLERFTTTLEGKVEKGGKVKVKHQTGSGFTVIEGDSKKWKVGYEVGKKTLYGQYEHKFQGFDMKVKQKIPDGNWGVVPSPEIEIETKLLDKSDMTDCLELKYDTQKRLASLEETVKFGKMHETGLSIDSRDGIEGAMLQWKVKPGKQYAKTVTVKYSKNKGPVLGGTAEPNKWLGVKVESAFQPKVLKGEITVKPHQAENAELGVSWQHPFNSAEKPRMQCFLKWKFK